MIDGDSGIGRAMCHSFALDGAIVAFTFVKAYEDKDAHDTLMTHDTQRSIIPDVKEPIAIVADLGYDDN